MSLRRDPLQHVEQLIPRVYAYVAYRIGHGPDAEDVTSDCFERALRYRDRYDSRRGEPLAWLIGIARNCIAEAMAVRPAPAGELPDTPARGDLADDAILRLDTAAAVGRLEERDRELIALRYGADLTARQIARLRGERTNAVEVALHRALGRLRAELERESGPHPAGMPSVDAGPVSS